LTIYFIWYILFRSVWLQAARSLCGCQLGHQGRIKLWKCLESEHVLSWLCDQIQTKNGGKLNRHKQHQVCKWNIKFVKQFQLQLNNCLFPFDIIFNKYGFQNRYISALILICTKCTGYILNELNQKGYWNICTFITTRNLQMLQLFFPARMNLFFY
jgi:hypothetical protein